MAIQPNMNPESAAVIGSAWPEHDEDAFFADAEEQRKIAEAAASGAASVSVAGAQTAEALTGGAGGALQARLGEDSAALSMAGDRHVEAASHLDAAAISIQEAKAAMNSVDVDYHAKVATITARAAVEGWAPTEIAAAKSDLLSQAQQAIASIRAGFEGAYEGVVAALTATSSGASAPTIASGTVEIPPVGGVTNAHQMGHATAAAAVDFTAGVLSGVSGAGASFSGAGSLGVGGGVYAPGYGSGALGGMGTGYGVLAPPFNPAAGYGYGMGGMPTGMMGAPQSTPLHQLGQVIGGIAQSVIGGVQAGVSGQFGVSGQGVPAGVTGHAGLTGQAGGSAQGSLGALLHGGLQADLNGAVDVVGGLQTDLASASSGEDVEQALIDAIDAVAADPDGDGVVDPDPAGDANAEAPAPVGEEQGGSAKNKGDAVTDEPESGTESQSDGSIPSRPVADTAPPADPVTRLQTDLNAAIAGAATAAHSTVDATADSMRTAMNTQVGFVTTAEGGVVRADTIGLQGPQHIEAIRTETSSGEASTRESTTAAASAPAASPGPSPAPYGAGSPVVAPGSVPAAPIAAAPGAAQTAPHPVRTPVSELGAYRPADSVGSPAAPTTDAATSGASSGTFLSLLPGPVAGAHTRLALLRAQQFANNAVTATAVGVFESEREATYVVATAHGVSYLPHEGSVPSDTRLLSELVPDHFYGQWCGHTNPVSKLMAFAAGDPSLGNLSYVLTTLDGVHAPGIEVVTQSLTDVKSIVESNLLAPTSRRRRDIVLGADADLGDELREMAMRTQVLGGDEYLHVLGRASGALWSNDVDRSAYLPHWLRVLTADALRAVDRGSAPDAWFAVSEYRRAERMMTPAS
ncbi:hypothetical protein [Rhodococcus pyridinivorans]|uniref:hypothetical protein n=1 Tax=Rhodococcus pyridinivorans TaxID=103816 RepID=UPI00265934BC|nr:hypothetical protein [Rhodococcus pyridinivorans]